MLIGRNPQKKGKKMMGGYNNAADIANIKTILMNFFNLQTSRDKIKNIIKDYYSVGGHSSNIVNNAKQLYRLFKDNLDDDGFHTFIKNMNGTVGTEINDSHVIDDAVYDHSNISHVKKLFTLNYWIIIKTLCNIYFSLYNHSDLSGSGGVALEEKMILDNPADPLDNDPWDN